MSGDKLIRKFLELGIPGVEKLQGSDYDWIFLNQQDDNLPLIQFLEWFIENVHSSDILSPQEISE